MEYFRSDPFVVDLESISVPDPYNNNFTVNSTVTASNLHGSNVIAIDVTASNLSGSNVIAVDVTSSNLSASNVIAIDVVATDTVAASNGAFPMLYATDLSVSSNMSAYTVNAEVNLDVGGHSLYDACPGTEADFWRNVLTFDPESLGYIDPSWIKKPITAASVLSELFSLGETAATVFNAAQTISDWLNPQSAVPQEVMNGIQDALNTLEDAGSGGGGNSNAPSLTVSWNNLNDVPIAANNLTNDVGIRGNFYVPTGSTIYSIPSAQVSRPYRNNAMITMTTGAVPLIDAGSSTFYPSSLNFGGSNVITSNQVTLCNMKITPGGLTLGSNVQLCGTLSNGFAVGDWSFGSNSIQCLCWNCNLTAFAPIQLQNDLTTSCNVTMCNFTANAWYNSNGSVQWSGPYVSTTFNNASAGKWVTSSLQQTSSNLTLMRTKSLAANSNQVYFPDAAFSVTCDGDCWTSNSYAMSNTATLRGVSSSGACTRFNVSTSPTWTFDQVNASGSNTLWYQLDIDGLTFAQKATLYGPLETWTTTNGLNVVNHYDFARLELGFLNGLRFGDALQASVGGPGYDYFQVTRFGEIYTRAADSNAMYCIVNSNGECGGCNTRIDKSGNLRFMSKNVIGPDGTIWLDATQSNHITPNGYIYNGALLIYPTGDMWWTTPSNNQIKVFDASQGYFRSMSNAAITSLNLSSNQSGIYVPVTVNNSNLAYSSGAGVLLQTLGNYAANVYQFIGSDGNNHFKVDLTNGLGVTMSNVMDLSRSPTGIYAAFSGDIRAGSNLVIGSNGTLYGGSNLSITTAGDMFWTSNGTQVQVFDHTTGFFRAASTSNYIAGVGGNYLPIVVNNNNVNYGSGAGIQLTTGGSLWLGNIYYSCQSDGSHFKFDLTDSFHTTPSNVLDICNGTSTRYMNLFNGEVMITGDKATFYDSTLINGAPGSFTTQNCITINQNLLNASSGYMWQLSNDGMGKLMFNYGANQASPGSVSPIMYLANDGSVKLEGSMQIASGRFATGLNYGVLNSAGQTGYVTNNGGTYSLEATYRISCSELDVISDRRVKSNIESIPDTMCAALVSQLNPVMYEKDSREKLGFIAQEVRGVLPQAVTVVEKGDIPDFHLLDHSQILSAVVGSIQYLLKKIERLEERLGGP